MYMGEKGRDLTQSYDKSPYTHRKIQKPKWQHKNATKTSITQHLRTDLGRSVGVTIATKSYFLLEKNLIWHTEVSFNILYPL